MDKKISIIANVDEISFSKAKAKIADLVAEVKKLADVSKGIDLGGILGGVGNNRKISGTGSAASGGKTQVQNVSVGGVDNLTNAAAKFKGAGDAARVALKGMSDAFKEHVGSSTKEGQKLTKELSEMEKALGRVQKAAKGLKSIGGGGGSGFTAEEHASIQSPIGRAWGKAQSMGGMSVPGMGGFDKAGNAMATRFGGAPGGLLAKAGGVGAAVGAVLAATSYAMSQRQDFQMNNLDYMANHQPFMAASRAATYGQIFGGNAQSIKGGDLARSMAITSLSRGDGFKSILGSQRQNFQKFIIDKGTPTDFLSNPTMGNAYERVKQWIGQKTDQGVDAITKLYSGDVEIPGLSKMQVNEVKNRMQKDFMASRSAEDFQKMIDLKMQQDPVKNAIVNEIYGNALGETGLARAAGIGGGIVTRKDGSRFDSIKMLEARFLRRGYTGAEGAGMMQQVGATAGRGLMHSGTESLLSAQAGGLANAVGLYGIGAQFGGGGAAGAAKMFAGMQGMIGRGGLDVTAGSQILGAGTAAMTAGNFSGFGPGAGLGFLQTLADAGMYGSAGGDMLGARQVQSGMGAIGSIMSGGLDPLQQGLNYSAALKAAPGGTYTTHKGLLGLDLATATEIAITGNVPLGLRSRGVTADMVKQYVGEQNRTSFSRYTDRMGMGSEVGAAVSRYREAGGLGYLKGAGAKKINAELSSLAEGLMDSTGVDRDTAMGRLRIQAASTGILAKAMGRGARDPVSRGSAAMTALGQNATFRKKESDDRVVYDSEVKGGIGEMTQTYDGQEQVRRTAQRFNDANDPEAALVGVTNALETFIRSLKNMKTAAPVRAMAPKP